MNGARPRLVHVIHHDGPGGGPQSVITQMGMLAGHYEQAVLHGGTGRIAAYCEKHSLVHQKVALDRKRLLPLGLWQSWRALQRLRPDVLVLHGQWGGAIGAIAGWLARVPHRAYIARWPAFYANWDLLRCLRNHLAERVACRLSHRIICLTDSSRYQYLLRRFAPENRLVVVPNALTTEGVPREERIRALCEQYGFARYTCNVISVGRLVQQKRSDWLLASWRRVVDVCPGAHLWMVGQGPLHEEWASLARSLQIESHVTWIEDQQFKGAEFIAAGDILAHTALFESFGNVVLEAMACGKPVVATEVDGPRSIIADEVQGLLVPPADTVAFADALISLIRHPEQRAEMGRAGQRASKDYTPERIAPLLLSALSPQLRPRMTHVVHFDGPGGGPPIIVTMMRHLDPWCEQSAIGGGRGLVAQHCERNNLMYREISPRPPAAWFSAAPALWRHIRNLRPDIVLVHGQPAGPVGAVIARLAGVRKLIYVAQWPAFYTDWDWFRVLRNRMCEWLPCRLADVIITFTSSSRHQYILRRLAPETKMVCIPPALLPNADPVPAEIASVRNRHDWSTQHRHVVSVARLSDQKCMDQLLTSWANVIEQCPDARLWIVGDGPERASLEALVTKLGISQTCRFLGYQTRSRAYMAAADILVITSMYESFGYVAVEGCACGTPIVASRVDGLMDIIRDGCEGFLVPPGNTAEMATRLVQLLNDPELRATMGRNARLRAANFYPDQIYPRWLDMLHNRLHIELPKYPSFPS